MQLSSLWRRNFGLNHKEAEYAFVNDPVLGPTAAKRESTSWVKSTCGYCSVGCGMEIGVRNGEAVAVRGTESHPVNLGKLCPKGLAEHHTLKIAGRATHPMLKRNGRLEPVSWDEAIAVMVERFGSVQNRFGRNSLGVIGTGQLLTEEFYALGKLVQLGFRTSNYCGNTTLCMASAVSGYKRSFGSDGPPGAYNDLQVAELIILIGANLADNHPILCQQLEANKGKYLVVVDPRVTKTAMLADLYVPLKPRTDIALLNGMAHVIIRDGLVNAEYVAAHTNGFEVLKTQLQTSSPEAAAACTGLPVEMIVDLAHRYAKAGSATIAWTMGVNHSTQGAETVSAINNLALLTGQIGKPGSSPLSITGQCNAMGTREFGFTSSLPGYRKFESETDRRELAAIWNVAVEKIPSARGLAYPDIINAAVAGQIKALWIIATNPVVSYPNQAQLRKALSAVEFLVVQDGFHPTPTSELADLVLPAAIWGEKEGCYTNTERRVGKVNAAVRAPGQAKSDFEIVLRIARELGIAGELYPGWEGPADAFEEMKVVSKGRLCDYSGMSYSAIEDQGGMQWPVGKSRLYEDGRFAFEDGRARLLPVDWQPFPDQPDESFPLVLNTGRTVEHWHTRTKTAGVALLERMAPNAWLEMNPADAACKQFRNHELVTVRSRRGVVTDVELRLTQVVAPGQVFMPFHFVETNVNEVTQDALDPISREPNYKQCAVRVERRHKS